MNKETIYSRYNSFTKSILVLLAIFFISNSILFVNQYIRWNKEPYKSRAVDLGALATVTLNGKLLMMLPAVDEKSYIFQPIITLQNYFIKNAQSKIPSNDVEKDLYWYTFYLTAYLVPNAGNIKLYVGGKYTYTETKEIMIQVWKTIENIVNKEAKDSDFNEMRYAAFNNLSLFYLLNQEVFTYKLEELVNGVPLDVLGHNSIEYEKLKKLILYIDKMDNYYKEKYPKLYKQAKSPNLKLEEQRKNILVLRIEPSEQAS